MLTSALGTPENLYSQRTYPTKCTDTHQQAARSHTMQIAIAFCIRQQRRRLVRLDLISLHFSSLEFAQRILIYPMSVDDKQFGEGGGGRGGCCLQR